MFFVFAGGGGGGEDRSTLKPHEPSALDGGLGHLGLGIHCRIEAACC